MTVSTEVDHNDYTGNGVTMTFPYTFRIFQKSDLVVQVVDLNGDLTVLILDTDYTVTGAGGYTGGNVILTTALSSGYQISISRELPVTQETDLRNQGKFFAEVHEDAFDKLTMLIQQVRSWFGLSLRKPTFIANYYDALNNYIRNLHDPRDPQDATTKYYVDTLASTNLSRTLRVPEPINEFPVAADRANKMPAFDNDGNAIVVLPPSGSASDVLIELAKPTGSSLSGHQRNGVYTGNVSDYFEKTYKEIDPDEFSELSTDNLRLQSAVNFSGKVQLKKKQYTITSPITCDFSSLTYPVLSRDSSRFDIIGVGIHSSVINYTGSISAINLLGNSTWSAHGTNSVMSLKDFCVYGPENKIGTGIRLTGLARMRVESVRAVRCSVGLRVSECLSNYFDKIYIDSNVTGMNIDGSTLTNNATRISGNFSNNSSLAIDAVVGTEFTIRESIFEHNGTAGVDASGDIRIRINQTPGVVNIENCYFGFSNGGASIKIDNITNGIVVVNISKCMFTRGGPNGEQVNACIAIVSSGGGRVVLNLDGNMFYTNTTFGYVPSNTRPFIDDGGVSIISGMDTCFFNEQTSKKPSAIGSSNVISGSVYDTGDGTHPQFLTSTRASTGVYTVTSSIPLSNTISGYQVTCMSQGSTVRPAYVVKNSVSEFIVYTLNTSNAAANASFDYQISRSR